MLFITTITVVVSLDAWNVLEMLLVLSLFFRTFFSNVLILLAIRKSKVRKVIN